MAEWHKEKAREAAAHIAPTREDVLFDIQQVMTLLVELEHEPHGSNRQAAYHSKRLAELVQELRKDLQSLPENERAQYEQDIETVLNLSVDGGRGRQLRDYLEQRQAAQWGREFAAHWEESKKQQAMRSQLESAIQQLRQSVHHRGKHQ